MRTVALTMLLLLSLAAAASAGTVRVENDTPWQIDHVYIAAASSEDWGYDRLGEDQVIAPRETWTFRFTSGEVCKWDLAVTFHDGTHRTLRNQNLCSYQDPIWHIRGE